MNIAALVQLNAQRWGRMQIQQHVEGEAHVEAALLKSGRDKYIEVQQSCGVPWWFVAVVHLREASCSWKASLAQGDPWNAISTHVPKGIGPFREWEDAAVYAMLHCGPRPALNRDWSIGQALTLLEEYNGLGYASRGLPSPYLWAGTDQYRSGKFITDGHFDPAVVDKQLGCAAILRMLGVS